MKENLKDYFYFTRREKNGILALLFILLILIAIPYIFDFFSNPHPKINQNFEKEIKLFEQSFQETEEPEYKNKLDQYIINRYDSINLFFFNPNNTSRENYKKLGFTDKQINTIFNYLNKGGKFYVKDDFRKIYGIRNQQYEIVKSYILLPDDNKKDFSKSDKLETNQEQDKVQEAIAVFDPNTASDDDFKKLGLTESNIKTIRNYIKKIGKFKSKEDFKKIYGLSEEKYIELEPYIFINQAIEKTTTKIFIDLNTAEFEDLDKIKGIGKASADAIIQYRKKLGGFVSIDQLLEIKIIKPEMFELFKSSIYVDKTKIKTISLNFAETKEFAAHPYLNYSQAKEILKYRSTNGPFQDKKQLVQSKILLESTYKKIEPYLTIN